MTNIIISWQDKPQQEGPKITNEAHNFPPLAHSFIVASD